MNDYVILDTETTGLGINDEVIELGIIDMSGQVLYGGMFNPTVPISPGAQNIHGISIKDVEGAVRFRDEWFNIARILHGRKVLIYNATFDVRMLNQTARKFGFPDLIEKDNAFCVMRGYAKYHGKLNSKTGKPQWIKLENALRYEGIPTFQTHRATDDCLMTLALIKKTGRIW